MNVGSTAFITAITEVISMLLIGYLVGQLLGWGTMNSIFLGGMLSMSSTTIIIKAFNDLELRNQRFTGIVSVSYTHLDVYKRQTYMRKSNRIIFQRIG